MITIYDRKKETSLHLCRDADLYSSRITYGSFLILNGR